MIDWLTRVVALLGTSALMIILVPPVLGQTKASVTSENVAEISDDGLGVEIRIDKSGELLSVRSTYYHPVEFNDRRGIAKAYIIAEEKAKANIARYMSQVVATTRVVSEIDDSLTKSSRNRSSTGENWTKDNSRTVVESLREITTSSAAAVLKGVRIISRSYDEKKDEVKVVVGINRESQSGADQLRSGLTNSRSNDQKTKDIQQSATESRSFPSVSSESKKVRDSDKF